jgi:hypothetical protein
MQTCTGLVCGLLALSAAPLFAAPPRNFFPLEPGNEWILTDSSGEFKSRITVGTPLSRDGVVFYSVNGLADQWLWIRQADDGALYYLDPETEEERPLLDFNASPDNWQPTGLRAHCAQEVQRAASAVPFQARRSNSPAAAVEFQYRSSPCSPDTLRQERYVENLGPVFRRITTADGYELDLELTYARVGSLSFNPTPHHAFQVALEETHLSRDRAEARIPVRGHVRLTSSNYAMPTRLHFPLLNRLEIIVRNEQGEIVHRETDSASQLPAPRTVEAAASFTIPFQFSFADRDGKALPDGLYSVTAWFLTDDPEPRFIAQTQFRVGTLGPAQ